MIRRIRERLNTAAPTLGPFLGGCFAFYYAYSIYWSIARAAAMREKVLLWLPVAVLYRTLGLWAALALPIALGILFWGLGLRNFWASRRR